LKQITNACISKVEDDDDIEDKDNLLNQLIQWKNSLIVLKTKRSNKTNENYDLYFQNFNAVYNILLEYKKTRILCQFQLVVKLK
jgi:hypothetical protein